MIMFEQEKKRGRPPKIANRPRRSAVGGKRDILTANGNLDFEKYHYHIVNMEGTNIEEFKSYGYEIDESQDIEMGTSNAKQSGSANTAIADRRTGMKAVLMRQPIENYREDQELRASAIAESEGSMLRDLKTADGRYGEVKAHE
jgi:hypothetical protein